MAVTLDELRAVMRMELNPFMKDLQKMNGVTAQSARRVEATWQATNKRLDNIGRSMAQSLVTPLLGLGAALSVDSVGQYADAWTKAKNSLAVAGVVGDQQAQVLDRLYQSAQDNAAPIGALADLFGKASQASDVLGASQSDLLKFSDGVATALKVEGKSAAEASGALTQLGQLLGQTRVQAEEFNSINEGARPILMAVAKGLDEAGGSVSKLKELVNDGKVSGQQFFEAFLKGLPSIQKMAANATQTIEQGVTKVNNAFTKYIGQTDESLSASQRLVAGLNALADNFEEVADVTLKVASVIAAALVGRSIAGMIASLGLATSAVFRFVAALRTASTMAGLATAMGGLTVAAGPIGAVIGVAAVGALALFSSSSEEAAAGANSYAEALEEVRRTAEEAAPAITGAANKMSEAARNGLQNGIKSGLADIERTKEEALSFFDGIIQAAPKRLISETQLASLAELRDELATGKRSAADVSDALYALANSSPKFQRLADQMAPLLKALQEAISATSLLQGKLATASGSQLSERQLAGYSQYYASRSQSEELLRIGRAYADETQRQNSLTKEQLALEKEIASVRKGVEEKGGALPESEIKAIAEANLAADAARAKSGRSGSSSSAVKETSESRFSSDIQAVKDRTAALIQEQQILSLTYQEQEKRRLALDLEQTTLADLREEARRKGQTDLESIQLSAEQRLMIDEASSAYARQADVLRQVEEAQGRAQDSAQEFYDSAKSGFLGLVKNTESLGDALSNLASKLSDLVMSSAFDALFGGSKATGAGGWLSNLFSGFGGGFKANTTLGGFLGVTPRVNGGPVNAGQPYIVGEKRPELFVPNVSGRIIPKVPTSSGMSMTYAPVIDARGADAAAVARLERELARQKSEMQSRVEAAVRSANSRNVKLR